MVQLASKAHSCAFLALCFVLGACGEPATKISTGAARASAAPEAAPSESPAQARTAAASGGANSAPILSFLEFEPTLPSAADERVRIRFDSSDADGDALFFHYEWTVDSDPAGGNSPEFALSGIERGQKIEVEVVANDGKQATQPSYLSVRLGNAPPEVASITTDAPNAIVAGSEVFARTEAHDPDGDAVSLRHEWKINGRAVHGSGDRLDTRRIRRGDEVQVTVVASDGDAESPPLSSPAWIAANTVPEIVSVPGEFSSDGVFHYAIEVRDPDGDRRFELRLADAPEGMQLDPASASISWTPRADQAGLHSFTVLADDGHGGVGQQQLELRIGDPAEASPAAVAQ